MGKGILVPGEWAKHLRPEGKRRQAKAERRAGKTAVTAPEPVAEPKRTKRRKRYGLKHSWSRDAGGGSSYTVWYRSPRARQDALEHYRAQRAAWQQARDRGEVTLYGCMGDQVEFVER